MEFKGSKGEWVKKVKKDSVFIAIKDSKSTVREIAQVLDYGIFNPEESAANERLLTNSKQLLQHCIDLLKSKDPETEEKKLESFIKSNIL